MYSLQVTWEQVAPEAVDFSGRMGAKKCLSFRKSTVFGTYPILPHRKPPLERHYDKLYANLLDWFNNDSEENIPGSGPEDSVLLPTQCKGVDVPICHEEM